MKKTFVVLIVAVALSIQMGCASFGSVDLGSIHIPDVTKIATREEAQEAIYVTAELYRIGVAGRVNVPYAHGRLSEASRAKLLQQATTIRDGISAALVLTQLQRAVIASTASPTDSLSKILDGLIEWTPEAFAAAADIRALDAFVKDHADHRGLSEAEMSHVIDILAAEPSALKL